MKRQHVGFSNQTCVIKLVIILAASHGVLFDLETRCVPHGQLASHHGHVLTGFEILQEILPETMFFQGFLHDLVGVSMLVGASMRFHLVTSMTGNNPTVRINLLFLKLRPRACAVVMASIPKRRCFRCI